MKREDTEVSVDDNDDDDSDDGGVDVCVFQKRFI